MLVNEQTCPSASIPLQGQTMLYIVELFSDKFFWLLLELLFVLSQLNGKTYKIVHEMYLCQIHPLNNNN